jgi:hypothetical protein
MAETMIRKQVYLGRAQDRKLKRLARDRGRTESELIREAIDQLPDPEGDLVEQLVAAGVLLPKPPRPAAEVQRELEEAERELEELWASLPEGLTLSDAVLAEREEGW